jgi:hypothetical protein
VVLTNREHVIALEARDRDLMGMLLRYPYEVRDAAEYFDDIQDVKITKDMLDLAKHIVEQKSGHFDPNKCEDHYEKALQELLEKKQKGLPIDSRRKIRLATSQPMDAPREHRRCQIFSTGDPNETGQEGCPAAPQSRLSRLSIIRHPWLFRCCAESGRVRECPKGPLSATLCRGSKQRVKRYNLLALAVYRGFLDKPRL